MIQWCNGVWRYCKSLTFYSIEPPRLVYRKTLVKYNTRYINAVFNLLKNICKFAPHNFKKSNLKIGRIVRIAQSAERDRENKRKNNDKKSKHFSYEYIYIVVRQNAHTILTQSFSLLFLILFH